MDFQQMLLATMQADEKVRSMAEHRIKELEQTQFAFFLAELVKELSMQDRQEVTRVVAATQIKRILTGQDDAIRAHKLEQWRMLLDEQARQITKTHILHVLATAPVKVAKQAAQCVEAIARLELGDGKWNELPGQLLLAFEEVRKRDPLAISGPLLALGDFARLAAQTDYEIQVDHVNGILSCISVGMNPEMPEDVQVTATEALSDTLDFARHNMDRDEERAVIIEMILRMTASKYSQARQKAFQCLTAVLTLYYHHLNTPGLMEKIWEITKNTIRDAAKDEDVAKQALNFWDEMAYEEAERQRNLAEASRAGRPPRAEDQSFGFIQRLNQEICDLVLNFALLFQDTEASDDDSADDSLYRSAEHCFVSLCSCLDAAILQATLGFIDKNLHHQDWRRRQAAIFAFGSVLREVSAVPPQTVALLFPLILQRILAEHEPIATVRETAAWAIKEICAGHKSALRQDFIKTMINTLLLALKTDRPRVAHMAAAAIHSFASLLALPPGEPAQRSNLLSNDQLFEVFAGALWDAASRPDSDKWQLMEDSYEALIKLIEVSPLDMLHVVGKLLGHFLIRLDDIRTGKIRDSTGYMEVELCDAVISCVMKLEKNIFGLAMPNQPAGQPTDANVMPDNIVMTMINVLKRHGSSAHPGALQAIGEIARIAENKFARYRDAVMPLVYDGLRTSSNAQNCIAAVRLSADICTALGTDILPAVGEIYQLVANNLKSDVLLLDVKPPHLAFLGDLAIAIGWDNFRPYVNGAMNVSYAAAMHNMHKPMDVSDEEYADFVNKLREAAIESMELMLIDCPKEDFEQIITFSNIIELARQIAMEVNNPMAYFRGNEPQDQVINYRVSPTVIYKTFGLVGDTTKICGANFARLVRQENVLIDLLNKGAFVPDKKIKEVSVYAMKEIEAALR